MVQSANEPMLLAASSHVSLMHVHAFSILHEEIDTRGMLRLSSLVDAFGLELRAQCHSKRISHRCLTFLSQQVHIVEASKSAYAAVINARVLVKIGPGRWDPTSVDQSLYAGAWRQELAGPGFMVWTLAAS